jgi:TonB-dependent starch-binding outer membrane protein SusC
MLLKMLAKRLSIVLTLLAVSFLTHAQQKTITGKVTNDKDGSPLSGASVVAKGSKSGTQTAADGTFSLSVASTVTQLEFSSVGYNAQSMLIGSGNVVNAGLTPVSGGMTEVVVIGYGTARRKDLTGAVASVQAKDFNQGVITSPDQLLQNKVPGLEVTSNSGQPGAATTVKIRGNSSIRGSGPLYVIDGVPLDGRSARPNFGTNFGASPDANPLLFINPNDIQSIDVLKDASSAAIYGSRGANGVIAITTKTGTSGLSKIEFGSAWSVNAGLMKKYEVLDAGEFRSALGKYNITGQDKGSTVNVFKDLMNKKLSQSYNLAFSGGNDNGKFRASFLASSTNGTFKGSQLDKYIGTFNGQYKFLDKKLSLGFSLIAGHTSEDVIAVSNTAGSEGNIISAALQWNPTTDYKDANGKWVYPTNGSGNPQALLDAYDDKIQINSILANITASYKILKNLDYKFMYAINNSTGQRLTNIYGFLQGYAGLSGSGFGAISGQKLNSQTFTHTLNYNTNLTKKLSLTALAGYEYWKSQFSNNSFSARGFNTNLTQESKIDIPYTAMLQDGQVQSNPITFVEPTVEIQSYFGRVGLNYDDRFLVTATMRADGSSKFGKNYKYGYFPSAAVRWNVSNENFMKGNAILSNLAVRGSWGITGSQEYPSGAATEQYLFSQYNQATQLNIANPDLRWEETRSFNFGLEAASKNGRIYGSFDYYHKNTTNLLYKDVIIAPGPSGSFYKNVKGDLINSGVEFGIGATVIEKTNLQWDVNFNIAYNKNKLTNFTGSRILTGQINGQGVSGTLGQIIDNNYPIAEYFLKPFNGFNASGNQQIGNNQDYAGNPNPTTNYGFSTTLRYKKASLVINGGGAAGFKIYNNTATSVTNISGISNGRNIDKAAYESAEKPTSGVGASDRFLEKGNFFKLRNISLNYTVGNVLRYVKGLNVFVNASNLFVVTKFSGFDPEVNVDKSSDGVASRSIEYIPYPTARSFSFGFKFTVN